MNYNNRLENMLNNDFKLEDEVNMMHLEFNSTVLKCNKIVYLIIIHVHVLNESTPYQMFHYTIVS